MKKGGPTDIIKGIKLGGSALNLKSFGGKPMAFVLLAFVIGATVSQGSFAFADDSATNPFRAIWDAIGELQVKTESLQAQIDDLKSQQGTTVAASQAVTKSSEVSLDIDVSGGGGQTLITLVAANAGPDSAVGVKLTTFYETSLLSVNFIDGAECSDGSRGIIECYLGTITEDSESRVVIDATPIVLEQRAIVTADISSITDDSDLSNNHAESVFVTSTTPVVQPGQQEEEQEEQPSQEPEETGEQSSEEQSGEEGTGETPAEEQAPEEQEETGEEQPAEQPQEGEESTEEGTGEEQPAEGEQTSEEGTGESTEQGGEESSSESEGAESTGEQGGDAGESGTEGTSGEESSADEGSGESSGDGETSSGDTGSGAGSESSSDSGDSGSSDGGAGDSGGDSGDSSSSGDSGSGSDGGSSGDGGSDGGSSGGDSTTG